MKFLAQAFQELKHQQDRHRQTDASAAAPAGGNSCYMQHSLLYAA